MKKVIFGTCVLLCIAFTTEGQKTKKKSDVKKETAGKNTVTKKTQTKSPSSIQKSETITLTSTSANTALNTPLRLSISDPTIRALNANANGANIKLSPSGLVGVPKGTYGFANGKIILYSHGATSTGTITGMGSVGTGTSVGSVGAIGPAMGVNGKSPYAGVGPYGQRLPLKLYPIIDTRKSIRKE